MVKIQNKVFSCSLNENYLDPFFFHIKLPTVRVEILLHQATLPTLIITVVQIFVLCT